MLKWIVVLAALAAGGVSIGLTAPAWASTQLHEDGTGWVTGADAMAALGWDEATLQANAASLEFVAESESVTAISWECARPGGSEVLVQRTDLVVTETRGIVSAPGALWWGRVVGFRLEGFDGRGASSAVPEGPAPQSCPDPSWTPVPESTRTVEEKGEPVLAVVHDGVQHPVPAG
ncbi:hypothetical protein RCG67_00535 [Kocuria sp. CPCC 205292]|uniref:hypothetical protein n=1 Tax=Kocuria cellulosilytica TaxID=3071451 RepID=UPI0034D4A027